jgi:hypothetical protein
VFCTKLQNRLLRPVLDASKPPARVEIRRALATLEHAVAYYIQNARLAPRPIEAVTTSLLPGPKSR